MDKEFIYRIKGEYSLENIPMTMLVNIKELVYFGEIKAINSNSEIPVFLAKDIENIAIEIYKEYCHAKELIRKEQYFSIKNYPYLNQKKEYYFLENPKLLKNNIIKNLLRTIEI